MSGLHETPRNRAYPRMPIRHPTPRTGAGFDEAVASGNEGDGIMNTNADTRRAHIEAIFMRLRQHYADRTPLPGQDEGLSLAMLQRLYRAAASEGYGESVKGLEYDLRNL